MEKKYVAFTYALHWKNIGKSYYGVRYAKDCDTSDIGTKYFSSSREVKRIWKEHGRPLIIIDQMFTNVNEAQEYEVYVLQYNDVVNSEEWINKHDNNAPPVTKLFGDDNPMRKYEISDDYKRKLSESKKGNANPFMGKTHTDEAKRKIGEATKARYEDDDYRQRMSNMKMGKKQSDETRRKISQSNKGRSAANKDNTVYVFVNEDGRQYIGTQSSFYKDNNLPQQQVNRMVTGKPKKAKVFSKKKNCVVEHVYFQTEVKGWKCQGKPQQIL